VVAESERRGDGRGLIGAEKLLGLLGLRVVTRRRRRRLAPVEVGVNTWPEEPICVKECSLKILL
jgi:hypothetical protein